MYPFEQTALENQKGRFGEIHQLLQEQGFEEGGNWEYDHGFFDRKLQDHPGYLFVRIPVFIEQGAFGEDEAQVRLGAPLLLRHKYQIGNDDDVNIDVFDASLNQFQEPVDSDASLKQEDIEKGRKVIQQVEKVLQERIAES
jgi:hypothetical protein